MDAQLSVPSLVLVTLDDRLEACTDPDDEDVVSGILASIFSVVPRLSPTGMMRFSSRMVWQTSRSYVKSPEQI